MNPKQSQSRRLGTGGEPRLRELLDDPTLHVLMQRDGVRMEDLTDLMALMRKRLLADRWRRAA